VLAWLLLEWALSAEGPEYAFEAVVKSFHQAVGLQMGRLLSELLDVQQVAQGGPP
jgi:hypothetical protein